jgi:hypothetical protein
VSENGARAQPLGEAEYADLVERIRAVIAASLPPGSSLLVVSKGDAALLEIPGMTALHFPQDGAGGYAGHHPLDSAAATAELEQMRRAGAEYLVIPATARWWLDFYDGLALHLAGHGEVVADVEDACLIYGLGRRPGGAPGVAAIERPQASAEQIRDYLENLITTDKRLVVLEAVDGVARALAPFRAARLRARGVDEGGGEGVLAELELLAGEGAEYLVVPRSSDEWIASHGDFAAAVESSCRRIAEQRYLCSVFDLEGLAEAR